MKSTQIVAALIGTAALLAQAAETVDVEPRQSLQEAANKLQPGDTLLLAEGTYYQRLELKKSGEPGKPITIKAKVPGRAIITGAMETIPKFERVEGAIHKPVPASISASMEAPKLEQVAGAVYKTKWVPAKKWSGSGTGQAWVAADGRNLYNYTSMEEMKTCRRGKGRDTTPLEGFFYSKTSPVCNEGVGQRG